LGGEAKIDQSTKTLLFDSVLYHCRNEENYLELVQWFKNSKVSHNGKELDIEVTLKNKHTFMKRIWSSENIPLSEKEELLAELNKLDKGDWFEETKHDCKASHPANKEEWWNLYFTKDSVCEKWGLNEFRNSFYGWAQSNHHEFTKKISDEFFEKIADIIKSKGRSVAEVYYMYLQPSVDCDAPAIKKFEDLLAKTLKEDPDNTFFIKNLKDSITNLTLKQKGQAESQKYLDAKKAKL